MGVEGVEFSRILFQLHFILFFAGIIAVVALPDRLKAIATFVAAFIIGIVTSFIAICGIFYNYLEVSFYGGVFIDAIPFRVDALSAWFIIIINIVSVTGILYGMGYLKAYKPLKSILTAHWVLFLLFQSSMLWVCMVQNSIAFLVAWEIMSLSSMLLVMFEHTNPKVLKAGVNYMVQMHISVVFLTIAFLWVYFKTGSFDFRGIEAFFGANSNIWLFLVFFIGFGLKAGFLGLHSWLPHAHPAAPSHVSGVMSGVIVKMGIYGLFRVISFLKADYILLGEIVITISVLTGLFGIMNAAVHRDFKKMLAYCTIENIGIIGIGLGLGLIGIGTNQTLLAFLGFGGALLHVLNHSLFKSLLFYAAGSVYQQTHTRDMEKLGGLIKYMPKTALLFLIGAVAIAGIPPFNGFISEFLIYSGLLAGLGSTGISHITLMVMSLAGLSIIGGISILAFTKTFGTIFLGSPRQPLQHQPHEVSALMLAPQYILVAIMLLIAVLPGYFFKTIEIVLVNIFPNAILQQNIDTYKYIYILQNISIYSFVLLFLVLGVLALRWAVSRNKETSIAPTWGCGYVAQNPKIQYTGKSFSKTVAKLFNFILIEKKDYKELKNSDIFPKNKKYTSSYSDFFELRIIQPFVKQLNNFINLFKFIQNGQVQAYVLYGILFILVIIIGTVFTKWY